MGKEGLNPYQAHQKRITFIEKAVELGILDRIRVSERNQNIGIVYSLNDELGEKEIGKIYPHPSGAPLTYQRIQQISKDFLIKAREESDELQAYYSLEDLLTKRPPPISELTKKVKHAVEQGADIEEIKDNIELSSQQIDSIRKTLRKRGVDVPPAQTFAYFKAKAEAENDDQKLQEILDSFTSHFTVHRRRGQEKVLTDLSSVLRAGGFYFRGNAITIFVEKLKTKNIPIRQVGREVKNRKDIANYWIVYGKHQQRIIDALKDDPELQEFKKNPVQLIFGNFDGKLPTTNEIRKKTKYGRVRNLAKETLGVRIGGRSKITLSMLLDGCSVPIFKCRNVASFPLNRKEELQEFIIRKYLELN